MKKALLIIFSITSLCLTNCKKDSQKSSDALATVGSYLPVSAGSTWTYNKLSDHGAYTEKIIVKMTGSSTTINGKTYYTANSVSDVNGASTAYFLSKEHNYISRSAGSIPGVTIDLPLGDDSKSNGSFWTSLPTDNGMIDGTPASVYSYVILNDYSQAVYSNLFEHVIHTRVDLSYTLSGVKNYISHDIYLAKGVGIIEMDTYLNGQFLSSQRLTDYSIKK